MRKWLFLVVGVLLALIGLLWVLQGAGVIGGSVMTGQRLWILNGLLAVLVGAAAVVFGLRRTRGR